MIYQWGWGHAHRSLSAATVGETLEQLRQENAGKLYPQDVIAAARDAKSPMHGCFEWDDRAAAREHRLTQARELIGAIVVTYDDAPHAQVQAFTLVAGMKDEPRHYTATRAALTHRATREDIVAGALRELRRWRGKYRGYIELAEALASVDRVLAHPPATSAESQQNGEDRLPVGKWARHGRA